MSGIISALKSLVWLLRKIITAILVLVLLYIGVIVVPTVVEIFLTAEYHFEWMQAEPEEPVRAQQQPRMTNPALFGDSFNNHNVILYLVPLAGIWLLGRLARWRGRLPAPVFGTIVGLCFAMWVSWQIGEIMVDWYYSLSDEGMMTDKLRRQSWKGATLFALAVPILTFRWLRRGPGWLDRIMRGEARPNTYGSPAEAAGAVAERARLWLFTGGIIFTPILWTTFDWFDGTDTPGPFALTVRGLFVAWALWLILRDQIALAWPDRDQEKGQDGTVPPWGHGNLAQRPEMAAEISGRRRSGFGKRKPSDVPMHSDPSNSG